MGACASAAAGPLDLLNADFLPSLLWFDPRSAFGFAILTGLVIFSTTLAILHIRERRIWTERERDLTAELDHLRDAAERAELLMGSDRQAVVLWSGRDGGVAVEGDFASFVQPASPGRLLAFGSWLLPPDAGQIEAAVERLRDRGEGFRLVARSAEGRFIEAEGRAVGGRALLRLREVTGYRADLLRTEEEQAEMRRRLDTLRALLDSIDQPVWLRGPDGQLTFANRAYCAAVEAADAEDACRRSLELMERGDRAEAARRREAGEVFRARVAAIVAGARRVLDITEAPLPAGAGGIAQDVSELEALRADLQRLMKAHTRTLDQFPTAVAMFDSAQRLVFHNAAYRQLWHLDDAFLGSRPTDGEILDRLRSLRLLPEQADYRAWKAGMLDAYRSLEPRETWWYLPDRRTLRVVANPNPQGGLTYLFDDVSDRMHLESRYNSLIKVQSETLNTLSEGVALFGADGRLRLFNTAFAKQWRLEAAALAGEPHVSKIVELCAALSPQDGSWADLTAAVSGFSDTRLRVETRMERPDGSVLECAAEPLPDGSTLLTFVDVTASVNVERALTERNEALELASRLRNEFVHHVSYELRSPLTNIIGFTELLGAETIGELNERQREYAAHIMQSSAALLAIINDILDLASIDADTIELARERIDIRATIEAAARGINDRLVEDRLNLVVDVPADIGSFTGDAKRVRQILFNLLSNAAGFSSPGQTITVRARREGGDIVLSVTDHGRGIPEEVRERVFDRFESHTAGSGHRGVGLGLSIVRSFVELHGGRVELQSSPGAGTVVTCYFPAEDGGPAERIAA
ncbi:PAS domain-containing sensor histidine kinase [Enterovirga sp. DB1703]|uniref:histidine kinase n=1 Tax=Enterovirga aerilata TaxID=2730920 RepID=A0A849I1I9_9HYPH|nr:PAS domain-containing sensor histidine kinase [Enterovirga sp. DB1703]NNM71208.1 PAS domain-containing protein [Enterovirga sp. DB1703]